ncbi:MAG: hypothetical protein H7A46_18995 [Verrucomicrobiales bacterium]|nr:hypothetical protein [Verrucomicrobiales bacterium]
MLPLLGLFVIVGLPGAVAASDAPPTDDPLATLREVFLHPPEEAKPRGYWVWPHGNFDYATLRTELEEFKAKGLGGVDIFDLGIRDRDHVIPPGPGFLSVEQVDGIAYALEQAKRLGLKLGLIVSSSWNAGGTWTPPEFASMNLVAWREEVTGPQHYDRVLPFPELPDSFKKPYGTYPLQVPRDDSGEPRFHREVAVLACPLDATGRIVDPRQVRVLGDQVEAGGRLVCDLPEGRWLILRTVLANFGQQLWLPSDGSQGLTMDHFSKAATRHHFATVMNRLEARVGPLRDTALERLYLASYEANADVIWTPGFQEAFAKQHGYRIEPFLPALFGVEVENADVTGRFLHDYRRTVSDLFVNHLYREASRLCRERGLVLCSESGGPGAPLHDVPTEDLQALGAVDVMRGEFWNGRTNQLTPEGFEELQVVKPIASAAHIYGHRIVEMEAFTSTIHWSEGPADFKPLADRAFCEGMTRVVYHTMTHNLPEAGVPGWTYQAGTHMNTNLPWWNLSQQLHAYLARCSALLMQGWFVADVAYYRGSEVPNFGKPKHRRPGLGFGHDYDDLNTEVLLTARVDESGRIVLPSGMSYALLVLPPDDDRMELPVARHVETLVHAGATILGPRPKRTYGLADYRQQEAELGEIAVRLWGKEPGNRSVDRVVGQGRVVAGHPELELLVAMGLGPDLAVWPEAAENQLDFIHRRTDRGEIYFLRNIGTNALSFEADFRARGARPEAWDPVDGTMKPLAAFVGTEQGTRVPLHFEGHGSIFVVFPRGPETGPQITRVSRQGQRWFPRGTAGCAGFDATIEPDGSVRFRAAQPGEYTLAFADGTERRVRVRPDPEPIEITGPWEVRFPWGWDVPVHQEFATLQSWTESTNAATRAFSGSARYARQFDLPAERLRGEGRVMLDLGEVREVARVHLNGRDLGLSSFAPHVLDVTESIRAGENSLVIEVANTWLNRLRLDDTLPEAQRKTHTNIGGPVGGKRWRDVSPSPSGLLGPLRLRFEDDARIHVAPTQAG